MITTISPLVIGDRLDTDIEGASRAGLPSMLVLTGVTGVAQLLRAEATERPTFVAADLGGLMSKHSGVHVEPGGEWVCGDWASRVEGSSLEMRRLSGDGGTPGLDALRAACAAAWSAADAGSPASWDDNLVARLVA